MPRVPVHQRLGRGQHRGLLGRQETAHGDRSQVDEFQVFATRDDQNPPVEKAVARVRAHLHRRVRHERGEDGRAAGREPEQRLDLRPSERLDLAHRQEGIEPGLAVAQHRHVAGDQKRARVIAGVQAGDLGWVLAPIRSTVDPIDGKAEAFESSQNLTSSSPAELGVRWGEETWRSAAGAASQR